MVDEAGYSVEVLMTGYVGVDGVLTGYPGVVDSSGAG